ARVVSPDARGTALVRGVEQVVSSAQAAARSSPLPTPTAPLVKPSDPLSSTDPLVAERHFVRGMANYWAGKYGAAESDFFAAVRAAGTVGQDARYYYFLGLSQLAQGKSDEAREMLRVAGLLEKDRKPPSAIVSRALERIQGSVR